MLSFSQCALYFIMGFKFIRQKFLQPSSLMLLLLATVCICLCRSAKYAAEIKLQIFNSQFSFFSLRLTCFPKGHIFSLLCFCIERYSFSKKRTCQCPNQMEESSLLSRATPGRCLLFRLSAAHPSTCLCVHEISAFSIWRPENGKLMPRSPCFLFLSFSHSGCTRLLSLTGRQSCHFEY